MNKKGGFTDIFLFMIFAFIIVLISVVWIFIGGEVEDQLHDTLGQMDFGNETKGTPNATQLIDNSVGKTNISFGALRWISVLLIIGMALSIFIGSYLVTTKPIFFIPYIFITIIAIVVSVPISNTYEILMTDPTLASTFAGFTATNFMILQLPMFVTIIGITGGIIMFTRMGKREEQYYGY